LFVPAVVRVAVCSLLFPLLCYVYDVRSRYVVCCFGCVTLPLRCCCLPVVGCSFTFTFALLPFVVVRVYVVVDCCSLVVVVDCCSLFVCVLFVVLLLLLLRCVVGCVTLRCDLRVTLLLLFAFALLVALMRCCYVCYVTLLFVTLLLPLR